MKILYPKESSTDENEEIDVDSSADIKPSQKRHKKHKHKKHKKKKLDSSKKGKEEPSPSSSKQMPSTKSPNSIKLKIKLHEEEGKGTPPPKRKQEVVESPIQKYVDKIGQGLGLLPASGSTPPSKSNSAKKKKSQKKDSDTSSEEERWLDAIQSGKLHEVDEELKKIKPKDPKLMTARQRAMLERKTDKEPEEQLMALPSGYKEVVMTAEAIQRKAIKSQKRKQMADEKREKDKKKTMERLLKKQDSKQIKLGNRKMSRKSTPQIIYKNALSGPSMIIPDGIQFPLLPSRISEPPNKIKCSIEGCENEKRYSCSKTGFPLCSLNCYKLNLQRIQQIL